jgi:hypothetical protein
MSVYDGWRSMLYVRVIRVERTGLVGQANKGPRGHTAWKYLNRGGVGQMGGGSARPHGWFGDGNRNEYKAGVSRVPLPCPDLLSFFIPRTSSISRIRYEPLSIVPPRPRNRSLPLFAFVPSCAWSVHDIQRSGKVSFMSSSNLTLYAPSARTLNNMCHEHIKELFQHVWVILKSTVSLKQC